MNNKYFIKLCEKAITGNINESEKTQLNNWLDKSEINRNQFEELKKIWIDTSPVKAPQLPDIDKEWNNLNRKLELLNADKKIKKSYWDEIIFFVKSFTLPGWKPAIVSLIIFICIIAGYYLLSRETPQQQFVNIYTLNKEHRKIQLPDGSTVILNSGSSIKYASPFGKSSREVYMTGEAFFEVTKNSIPFNIFSSNAKISVLGTQFDVWARDGKTRVIVKEGKVKFARLNKVLEGVNLTANQTSIINENSNPTAPKEIDSQFFLGWMNGKLIFDRTPLNEVVKELERRYNIKIILDGDSLSKNTISGSFNNYGADTVLSMICLALNLKYEQQSGHYLIESKESKN